jgi:hypothetical protein
VEFEPIANRLVRLAPDDLMNCFISGIKSDICSEVLACQPSTISHVAGLTRLHEEKV